MKDHFFRDFIYKVINRTIGRPINSIYGNKTKPLLFCKNSAIGLLLSAIVLFTTLILPQNKIYAYADELSGLSPTFSTDVSDMPYRVPLENQYDVSHYSEWSFGDKYYYFKYNIKDLLASVAGTVISNMSNETVETALDDLMEHKIYMMSMSPEEWCARRFDLKKLGDNYEMAMTEDLYSLIIELANELKSQCDNDDDYRYGYSYDYRNYSYIGRDSDVIKAIRTIVKYAESNGYIVVADTSSPDLYVWKCEFYYVYYSSNSYGSCKVKKCLKENSSPDLLYYQYNGVSHRYELKNTYHGTSFNAPTVLLLQDNIDELKAGTSGNPSSAYFNNAIIGDGYIRYRIYDSEEDIVTPTYQEVSTTYYYYDSHNTDISDDDINNYIINYYNDNDRYPSTPEIIIYIQTIIPQPTPNPNPTPTPTPKPSTNTSTSDGVTVTQNANPVINVINNIKISLLDLFDTDDDTDPIVSPTPSPDPSDPNITPTPSPDPGPGTGSDDNTGDKDKKSVWKRIGDLLGSVFSGVGDLILGILEKLVDLIVGDNGILTAIQGIIDSLTTGIPNIIGSLITYFLPFLPDELIALISLTIVLAILLAVIRIIRGK